MSLMDIGELSGTIEQFRMLSVRFRYECDSDNGFIDKYLSDFGLRPYFEILFNALEEMEAYSQKDFEEMERKGVVFRQSPRYDFSCHEESAREVLYSFATGRNKFVCGLEEGLENAANLLENYRSVLEFKEKEG